jgi:hypothetical protein
MPDDCAGFDCELQIFNQETSAFGVAGDLSGDGRADLVLRVIRSSTLGPESVPAFETQRFYAFAMDAKSDSTLVQSTAQYGPVLFIRNDSGPQDARDFQFADFNGDGLSDLFYHYPIQGDDDYRFALNLGNGFDGPAGGAVTGSVQNIPNRTKLRLADINGDGRADVLYPGNNTTICPGSSGSDHVYHYRSWSMRFGSVSNGRIDNADFGLNPQDGA